MSFRESYFHTANKILFALKGNCLTILSGFKLHYKKNQPKIVIFNVEKLAPLTGAQNKGGVSCL
jgi:hypothetical protein